MIPPFTVDISATPEDTLDAVFGNLIATGWASYQATYLCWVTRSHIKYPDKDPELAWKSMQIKIANACFRQVADYVSAENPYRVALEKYIAEQLPIQLKVWPKLRLVP